MQDRLPTDIGVNGCSISQDLDKFHKIIVKHTHVFNEASLSGMHKCKWWKLNIDFVNCKSTPMTINAATINISHLCQIDIVIV